MKNGYNNDKKNERTINETRAKIQEFNTKMKEETKNKNEVTYRESLKDVWMSEEEINKTLTIEKEFWLDIEKSEFINAFVSKEIGSKFTYNTDLAGKYDTQIETLVTQAKETYEKIQESKVKPTEIENITTESEKEVLEKYTPEEIFQIEEKENPTEEEKKIRDAYVNAIEKQEMTRINAELEQEYPVPTHPWGRASRDPRKILESVLEFS